MRRLAFLVVMLLIMTIVEYSSVHGVCPRTGQQGEQMALNCMRPWSKVMDLSKGAMSSDELLTFCHGSASAAVDCLQKIFDDCAQENPTVRRLISKAIDLQAYRNALKYICDHVKVVKATKRCVSIQAASVKPCILTAYRDFKNELQLLQAQAYSKGIKWQEDAIIEALCSYNDGISDCVQPIRSECGDDIGDVYRFIILASRSPGCTNSSPRERADHGSSFKERRSALNFNSQGLSVHGDSGLLATVGIFPVGMMKARIGN